MPVRIDGAANTLVLLATGYEVLLRMIGRVCSQYGEDPSVLPIWATLSFQPRLANGASKSYMDGKENVVGRSVNLWQSR